MHYQIKVIAHALTKQTDSLADGTLISSFTRWITRPPNQIYLFMYRPDNRQEITMPVVFKMLKEANILAHQVDF